MSLPLVLMTLFLILGLAAFLLRRHPGWVAFFSAAGVASAAALVFFAPLDQPLEIAGLAFKFEPAFQILGRTLRFNEQNRIVLALLLAISSFLFGGSWVVYPHPLFHVAGFLMLAMVTASILVQPFLFAAIFLEFAAMGAILMFRNSDLDIQRASLRLLAFYTLAMIAILLSGWLLENVTASRLDPNLTTPATYLLGLGIAVVMAVPPFHLWLPNAARLENAYPMTFAVIILQTAGLFMMLQFLEQFLWLRSNPAVMMSLRYAGAGMVFLGGLWALAQQSMTRMGAFALLADFGIVLLAAGLNSRIGFEVALGLSGVRVFGLGTWGLSLSILRRRLNTDDFKAMRGVAFTDPLTSGALMIGILALAGFPLTSGFPARWALISGLAGEGLFYSLVLLFGWLSIGGASIRWGLVLLSEPEQEHAYPSLVSRERVLLLGGVGLCVLTGLFPQWVFPWILRALDGFPQLVP